MIKRILPAALIAVMMAGGDACARSWKNVYLTPTLVMKNIKCDPSSGRAFKFTVVNRAKQAAPDRLTLEITWYDSDGDALPGVDGWRQRAWVDLKARESRDIWFVVRSGCPRLDGWKHRVGICQSTGKYAKGAGQKSTIGYISGGYTKVKGYNWGGWLVSRSGSPPGPVDCKLKRP